MSSKSIVPHLSNLANTQVDFRMIDGLLQWFNIDVLTKKMTLREKNLFALENSVFLFVCKSFLLCRFRCIVPHLKGTDVALRDAKN